MEYNYLASQPRTELHLKEDAPPVLWGKSMLTYSLRHMLVLLDSSCLVVWGEMWPWDDADELQLVSQLQITKSPYRYQYISQL